MTTPSEQEARKRLAQVTRADVGLPMLAALRPRFGESIDLDGLSFLTLNEARVRHGLPPVLGDRQPPLMGTQVLADLGPLPQTIGQLLTLAEWRALNGLAVDPARDRRLMASLMQSGGPALGPLAAAQPSPEQPRPKPAGFDAPSTSTPPAPRKLSSKLQAWFMGAGLDEPRSPVTMTRSTPLRAPTSHARPRRRMPTPGDELAHAAERERKQRERRALALTAQGREEEGRLLLAPSLPAYRRKTSAEFYGEIKSRMQARAAIDRVKLAERERAELARAQ